MVWFAVKGRSVFAFVRGKHEWGTSVGGKWLGYLISGYLWWHEVDEYQSYISTCVMQVHHFPHVVYLSVKERRQTLHIHPCEERWKDTFSRLHTSAKSHYVNLRWSWVLMMRIGNGPSYRYLSKDIMVQAIDIYQETILHTSTVPSQSKRTHFNSSSKSLTAYIPPLRFMLVNNLMNNWVLLDREWFVLCSYSSLDRLLYGKVFAVIARDKKLTVTVTVW